MSEDSTVEKELRYIPVADVKIPQGRFRLTFSEKTLSDLQDSLSKPPGLINPITVRRDCTLIAGESRLKVIGVLIDLGMPVFFNGEQLPSGVIPVLMPKTDLAEVDYLTMELHENTIRSGFTFMEEQEAIAKIARINREILESRNGVKTGAEKIAEAMAKAPPLGLPALKIPTPEQLNKEAIKQTAISMGDGVLSETKVRQVREALKITEAVKNNPELAKQMEKVTTNKEAAKVLENFANQERQVELARIVGKGFSAKNHKIIHGDCLIELPKLEEKFDVCLTDPIYGINAGNFGNAAGKMNNFVHKYEDSPETFHAIMPKALKLMTRVMKPAAHVYLACDIRNYFALKDYLEKASDPDNPWKVTSAPFIQYKLGGGRVPVPGLTPRRSYELWLYAYRGGKKEHRCINDVIECSADRVENQSHGAGKPKELLKTFLIRSCQPGDRVLDFMAGSGSIIPACHELNLACTAIEISDEYYGTCVSRLQDLK